MKANKGKKVGDYVFLFFENSGSIFSARILEKTMKETLAEGQKTEYILEVYSQEASHIKTQRLKYNEENCKMFSDMEELEKNLHEHVNQAVNAMLLDCKQTFEMAKNNMEVNTLEKSTSLRR